MKSKIPMFLLLALCLLLSGCSKDGSPVRFYYPRNEFAYYAPEHVIVAEERDISGYEGNLHYLLSLYLVAPLEDSLNTPFPRGTRLLKVEQQQEDLVISLSAISSSFSDARFSLGCACMSMTAMEAAQCTRVTIISAERSLTLTEAELLLSDTMIPTETTEETP